MARYKGRDHFIFFPTNDRRQGGRSEEEETGHRHDPMTSRQQCHQGDGGSGISELLLTPVPRLRPGGECSVTNPGVVVSQCFSRQVKVAPNVNNESFSLLACFMGN